MQASPFDIALWNWEPLAATLAVGVAGVVVTIRKMNQRPVARTVLLAFLGALTSFGVAAVLLVRNSLSAHYEVANVADASPTLILEVWQAAQVIGVGLFAAAALPSFILLGLAVVASRRAV